MKQVKKCAICGIAENQKEIRSVNGTYMCPKHKAQMYRYGRITDATKRTVTDKNEIITQGNISKLILYNKDNTVKHVATIDTEDVERVTKHKWRFDKNTNVKNYGQVVSKINGKRISLHRFILAYDGNLEIDHINRNPLDNRKSNLRIVTRTENMHNLSGLGIFKEKERWRVQMQRYNKKYNVGRYETYEEAVKARSLFLENFNKKAI